MKIYTLTEEYCFDGEVTFEVIEAYKSEEQAIKAMKCQHESYINAATLIGLLHNENELYIEETNNSIYTSDETDSKFYYLLKVESTFLHD